MYRQSYFKEFGELVICYDSKNYWRREYFPEYKAGRRKSRETSSHDWNDIFECLNAIKSEIRENFPYKVLEVYGAEADDIIAALCGELEFDNGKTLILSGDKDFIQLHRFKNVKQYSPITKKFINGEDPTEYLYQHILKGDSSDGVPNVLSPDNTFVDGLRQKPLSKKKISEWAGPLCEQILPNDEIKRNYQRNKKLIDLQETPKELHLECIRTYQDAPEGDRSKLLNYFIKNRLNDLMENIGDF
jgi:5'-3' exonuclease